MPNGYNTIIETIKTNNLKSFQSIVHAKSPHLNKIQQFFQLSCEYNGIEILDYLFQLNPKIHIRDKNDLAFKLACKNRNLQIIKILYEKNNNIDVEKVLLDLLPNINPFAIDREITKFLFNKIVENKSVNKLQDILHKICAKIIKMYHITSDDYLLDNIIYKYIHLLDIFELCKIAIEYNELYLLTKFINYLEDNKLSKLFNFSLQKISTSYKISIDRYQITEYLIDEHIIHMGGTMDLYEYFKNSCKIGNKEFVEIMLSKFNYCIGWMLPSISFYAYNYKHTTIVDNIFTYNPELLKSVKEQYQKYPVYENLYNYLNSKININIFETDISICDEKCPICLEQHATYIKTKCGHIFGENCIKEWISYGNLNCPYCRSYLL